MALVAKRHAEEIGPAAGAKRTRFAPPLRELQNGNDSYFAARPTCYNENLGILQQQFPSLHVGIVSSILESSRGDVAEAAVALSKIGAIAPAEEIGPGTPARSLKRGFDAVSDAVPDSPPSRVAVSPTDVALAERQQSLVLVAADRLVDQLHGMPSVEAAKFACRQSLLAFAQEVSTQVRQRDRAAAEATAAVAVLAPDRAQKLSETNKCLFRAMQVLNDRNRALQKQAEEPEKLRAELDLARKEALRLNEANQVLQWHLQQSSQAQMPTIGFGGPGDVF